MTTRFSLVFAILMMCLLTLAVGYKKLVMERAPITVEEPSTPEDPETPEPEPEYTFEDAIKSVTSQELKDHVAYLASDQLQGRMSGTSGCDAARDYLKKELESYGYEVILDEFRVSRGDGTAENVYAWLDGTETPGEVVVVGAHYDHIGTSIAGVFCGADDNASGTAAVL